MIRTIPLLLFSAVSTVAFAADPSGSFADKVGIQLWSLRDSFAKDVGGTLDKVKALGFEKVETAGTYGLSPADFRKQLEQRGLNAVSAHFQYEALNKDINAVIEEAKALGVKYIACPWIPHEMPNFGDAEVKEAAADFNKWGEALKKEGIAFAYHPHGFEFRPHGDGTLFDMLVAETKPEFVAFEMDVFWVVHPGADPVALLQKYPNRFIMMHLKDIRKGARTGVYTGRADKTDDVVLGTGMVDWPAVLAAAQKAGVKEYFIEDESPTVESQLPASLKYLETVQIK